MDTDDDDDVLDANDCALRRHIAEAAWRVAGTVIDFANLSAYKYPRKYEPASRPDDADMLGSSLRYLGWRSSPTRHDRAALHFSGGKDSLTCLHLARPWWAQTTVMWVNTGAAFPETVELMEEIRAAVPCFLEVQTDVLAQVARDGPPADLLPVWNTPMGRGVHSGRPVAIQFPFACCAENIWGPMARATVELGATLVIRGQRAREQRRAPIASGHVEDGIEYLFPIEMPPGSRANTLPACGSRQGAALSKRFTSAQHGAFDAAAK